MKQGKSAAIIAYITFVGTIIAYFMNLDEKHKIASFHIRQALGIHILFYLMGILASMFTGYMIPTTFYIFVLVLWIYGLVTAIQGERKEIPLLGNFFQKIFKSIT
ncbi:hypothetical protein RM553_14490 [Zunongwangia sp. F363]|uniref:DUF4870 domain-containing protein n=1 Tax=Autumnicola tepida TaxID=3075595 RepID=A0ABU3CCH5_9FLAO|nr:hypothetical protein [Zunongwangia sp. F363]MDT0644043.1 hypothetical protein [Zunongwangia sp. F363]